MWKSDKPTAIEIIAINYTRKTKKKVEIMRNSC